jgi:Ca-activated chloride channel family protein
MKIIVFILFCGFSFVGFAEPTLGAIDLNKKGIEQLKKQNFTAAENFFIQALTQAPFLAELQLNLGLSFYGAGQMDKAQAAYEGALKQANNDQTRFIGNYNLGEFFQKAKKTEQALKYYQEALKYKPDSRETKVNIELLVKQQQGGGGQGKDNQDQKDQKDKKDGKSGEQPKDDKSNGEGPKSKGQAPKPKFNSKDLTQADVNKILGEIKQQEQKIRADFNRKDVKERPRDKDW